LRAAIAELASGPAEVPATLQRNAPALSNAGAAEADKTVAFTPDNTTFEKTTVARAPGDADTDLKR
jgi:hypothetical protein